MPHDDHLATAHQCGFDHPDSARCKGEGPPQAAIRLEEDECQHAAQYKFPQGALYVENAAGRPSCPFRNRKGRVVAQEDAQQQEGR